MAKALKEAPTRRLLLLGLCISAILYALIHTRDAVVDSDLWWLLETGRQIVDNGIPYANPWSIHEGQGVVVQQWLSAMLLYLLYKLGGALELQVLVYIQVALLVAALCRLVYVCSKGQMASDTALCLVAAITPALSIYWSTRPHLWTMLAYTLLLTCLEKFRWKGDSESLYPIPFIVALHVNLHASMALIDPLICCVYLLPSAATIRKLVPFGLTTRGKSPAAATNGTRILAIITALSSLALMLNPYGLKGAIYSILSYGSASYGGYISEMSSAEIWSPFGACYLISALAFAFLLGKTEPSKHPLSYFVLPSIFLILSIMHTRNIWLFPLFSLPWISFQLRDFSPSSLLPNVLTGVVPSSIVVLVCFAVLAYGSKGYFEAFDIENAVDDCASTPKAAIDFIEGNGLTGTDVMCTFDSGGYLEWHGLRVDMDARPELWEPGITGFDAHYYRDYVDRDQDCETDYSSYIEFNDFKLILIPSGNSAIDYVEDNPDWEIEAYGPGYTFWAKKTLFD